MIRSGILVNRYYNCSLPIHVHSPPYEFIHDLKGLHSSGYFTREDAAAEAQYTSRVRQSPVILVEQALPVLDLLLNPRSRS
jgi:hypothetical protein